jgi:hypothetical protein
MSDVAIKALGIEESIDAGIQPFVSNGYENPWSTPSSPVSICRVTTHVGDS